jgi:hypothetical protein
MSSGLAPTTFKRTRGPVLVVSLHRVASLSMANMIGYYGDSRDILSRGLAGST